MPELRWLQHHWVHSANLKSVKLSLCGAEVIVAAGTLAVLGSTPAKLQKLELTVVSMSLCVLATSAICLV